MGDFSPGTMEFFPQSKNMYIWMIRDRVVWVYGVCLL